MKFSGDMNLPLLLTDSRVSLVPNATLAFSDQSKFLNPYSYPMWIDAIQVTYLTGPSIADFRIRLSLNQDYITDQFVPACVLCPAKGVNRLDMGSSTLGFVYPFVVRWQLWKPLYVPAGQWVMPEVQHAAKDSTVTPFVNVQVSMIARSTLDEPEERWMPWVTSFVGQRRASGSDYTDASNQTNLYNKFDKDLFVERINGRVTLDGTDGGAAPSSATHVRMINTNGAVVVRDETPFNMLMLYQDRSWGMHTRLQPKGFYKVYLRENYSLISPGAFITPLMAMIGYRKEGN